MRPAWRYAASFYLAAIGLIATTSGAKAQAPVFPEDSEFVAAECGGATSTDPARDQSEAQGGRDIVGDSSNAAIFIAETEDYTFFRLRVDADPTGPGGFEQFGWVFLIDSDGDLTDFEFHVSLDGVGEDVYLRQNTTTDRPNDPTETPDDTPLAVYDTATHARVSASTSSIDGEPDFFITVAVAKVDLEA
ncbi:MAG: hypothetical protein H5U40_09830, partial [Polyangiaceae bacterium]|nr:hypothetical protein [Polyangiaceae bacterium]